MSDLKNTLSTIAGIMIALGGAIAALPTQGVVLPEWVVTVGLVLMGLGGVIMGVLQGRNADGTSKTPAQLAKQREGAK